MQRRKLSHSLDSWQKKKILAFAKLHCLSIILRSSRPSSHGYKIKIEIRIIFIKGKSSETHAFTREERKKKKKILFFSIERFMLTKLGVFLSPRRLYSVLHRQKRTTRPNLALLASISSLHLTINLLECVWRRGRSSPRRRLLTMRDLWQRRVVGRKRLQR